MRSEGEPADMSSSTPSVSVIIPTWNRAHTLIAAIQSALTQTPAPLEVLVCDDGSQDDSRSLVSEINDPRVRWIDGPHSGGPAVPRNRGLAASRGEWIAFLDSDDRWLPGKLAAQLDLARRLDVLAACGNAIRVLPGGTCAGALLEQCAPRLTFGRLLRGNLVVCSSAMFHRALLPKVGSFPEATELVALEDYALWLRVTTFTDFAFVGEPCVAYADDPSASIRSADARNACSQQAQVREDYLRWAPRLTRHVLALRLQTARAAFHQWQARRRHR